MTSVTADAVQNLEAIMCDIEHWAHVIVVNRDLELDAPCTFAQFGSNAASLTLPLDEAIASAIVIVSGRTSGQVEMFWSQLNNSKRPYL